MRCLALAQAWADAGGRTVFVSADLPAPLAERIAKEGFAVHPVIGAPGSVQDAEHTLRLARDLTCPSSSNRQLPTSEARPSAPPVWIVADGYHFDLPFQHAIRAAGHKLLLVDDYGCMSGYAADLLLNQNINADEYCYDAIPPKARLLGPRYALLRREFVHVAAEERECPPVAHHLLVTLGGSDPNDVTGRVADALRRIEDPALMVKIVAGPAYPHNEALHRRMAGDARFEIISFAPDMPALMRWADLAVTAGGSTCWELLHMGVPFAVIAIAENQRGIVERLQREHMAVHLGWHENVSAEKICETVQRLADSPDRRASMIQRGQRQVDGLGAKRVVACLNASRLVLRRATAADARMLWKWANDPTVRANSFHSEPIPWETHVRWLEAKLASPRTAIFVAEDSAGSAIGQIRFDWDGSGRAEVDVSLDAEHRNRGLGAALIRAGLDMLWSFREVRSVLAKIKAGNQASVRAFMIAGFDVCGTQDQTGDVVHLSWKRPYEQ